MRKWLHAGAWIPVEQLPDYNCPCGGVARAIGIERFAIGSADTDLYSLDQALWIQCGTCGARSLADVQLGPGAKAAPPRVK
jgi:hypothetical protein